MMSGEWQRDGWRSEASRNYYRHEFEAKADDKTRCRVCDAPDTDRVHYRKKDT